MGLNLLKESRVQYFRFEPKKEMSTPLLGNAVAAGFPSPAQDYIEASLDLNSHLIEHPAATFFMRVEGESMKNIGIYPDDILVVDRALEPRNRSIVIAVLDGDLTVKRLVIEKGHWFLMPENPDFKVIEITRDSEFVVWGVVVYAIHKMRG